MFFSFLKTYKIMLSEKERKIREVEYQKQIENLRVANQAQERERDLIARNLHDEIIPEQSLVVASLEMLQMDYVAGEFEIDKFEKQINALKKSIVRVRKISHELAPPDVVAFGVLLALKDYVERMEESREVETDFEDVSGLSEELPLNISEQMNLYRLCLEILNNLGNHSGLRYLKVFVEAKENELLIEFMHDGKGISNAEIERLSQDSKGLGLKSIQSRLNILHGRINYTCDNESASICIYIPLPE